MRKRNIFLYLSGIFIVAQVAANIGRGSHENAALLSDSLNDPQLRQRILAFEKDGVEKDINVSDYDIEGVIEYAQSLIGTPHVMGGYSRAGLDCSGLVKLAHAQFGVELPRSSHEQGRYGTIIFPGEKLRRGDLVFFHSTYKKPELITHSGIYLGENKFIHTSTSHGVSISTTFAPGRSDFIHARIGDQLPEVFIGVSERHEDSRHAGKIAWERKLYLIGQRRVRGALNRIDNQFVRPFEFSCNGVLRFEVLLQRFHIHTLRDFCA